MLAAAHKIQRRTNSVLCLLAIPGCRDSANVTISNGKFFMVKIASCPDVAEWVTETLSSIRARYSNKNLYNADETVVFWRAFIQ